MNFRSGGRQRRAEPTIDLMPLIDVVFLLLIFFLITTSFARDPQSAIPVNLPSGVSGETTAKGERVVLVVTTAGDVVIEGDITPPEGSFESRMAWLKREKPNANIMLKGDSEASHGRVVEILDQLKAQGFKKVNLVIKKR